MIAFIPVYRYRVEFQVATGHPYSEFDRLLLKAVDRGTCDLDELTKMFAIHRSVVVSALAMLMQAGWLGLRHEGGTTRYAVSRSGRAALRDSQALPSSMSVSTHAPANLIMERVEGQLIRGGDVTFFHRLDLEQAMRFGVVIQKSAIRHTPEPALVKPFLSVNVEHDEYIRSIGPINILRGGGDYVPAIVDPIARRIIGLPPAWESRLADQLYEAVLKCEAEVIDQHREKTGNDTLPPGYAEERRQIEKQIAIEVKSGWVGDSTADDDVSAVVELDSDGSGLKSGPSGPKGIEGMKGRKNKLSNKWPIAPEELSFVKSSDQHLAELVSQLRTAETWVVLVVTQLSKHGVDQLMPELTRSLARGVDIDIFWSQSTQRDGTGVNHGIQLLRSIESSLLTGALKGRLMVAAAPTTVATNVLIADHPGYCDTILGPYPWLGPPVEETGLSIKTRSAGLLSRLCLIIADMYRADRNLERSRNSQALLTASERLERIAIAARQINDMSPSSICGNIVFDREHYAWMTEQIAELDKRLEFVEVGTQNTESVLRTAWPDSVRETTKVTDRIKIHCPRNSSENAETTAASDSTNVIIVDDNSSLSRYVAFGNDRAIISTFDWMNTWERASENAPKHIGVSLRGEGAGATVLLAAQSR